MPSTIETEALSLIIRGTFSRIEDLAPESASALAVELLTAVAEAHPKSLLKFVRDAVECRIDGMVITTLAILTSSAKEDFFNKKTIHTIISILNVFGPPKLLEYVEYLKSKSFGRGMGSRPQKWVRTVMEGWQTDTITDFLTQYPLTCDSLVRLVHPRYNGNRGLLVKEMLHLKKNVSSRTILQ